jgi:molybdopterin converting factor small subunit
MGSRNADAPTPMKICIKLFANLSQYLPPGARQNAAQIDVPDGATPHRVMALCGVPREQAHLVVLNGVFVLPHQRDSLTLSEGDTLALWPPVAGG